MKYKELLDLYKSGRLSEEESKKLEAEIEKQEAISEYLYPDEEDEEYDKEISETEDKVFAREDGKISAKEDEFVKLVRKSIRKAFIKMGAVVTAAVLVIILLMITILPKAVDLLYYNPCAAGNYSEPEGVGGYGERFGLDLSIYTELTAPFNYLDSAEVVSEGYGNYSFSAYKSVIRNGETEEKYAGNIRKNRITFYDPMALESRADNMFEWQINNNDYNESLTKQLEKFSLKQLKTKENAEKRLGNLRLASSFGGNRNESKERIRSCFKNIGLDFPVKRVLVNLSPADIKKKGSSFDLGIFLGILSNIGKIRNIENFKNYLILGEISLNGEVKSVKGAINATILAKEKGIRGVIIPYENYDEACLISGVEIVPVSRIEEAVSFLNGKISLDELHKSMKEKMNLKSRIKH